MAITVLDVNAGTRLYPGPDAEADVVFPNKRLLFVDDSVRMSKHDLRTNSHEGLAEAVFFSFNNLHEILNGGDRSPESAVRLNSADSTSINDDSDYVVNSRVVSASLGRAGHRAQLADPVTIDFRHLKEENMTDPICVFWDYEINAWSGSGCGVLTFNRTNTRCQCDHLTNFAVLMRQVNRDAAPTTIRIRMDVVAYSVISVLFVAAIVATIKYRRTMLEWCCCCCRRRGFPFLKTGGHQGAVMGGDGAAPRAGGSGCFCCSTATGGTMMSKNPQHLEKCQSFYTGLSSQSHSQYVLTGQHLQAQSLLQCNNMSCLRTQGDGGSLSPRQQQQHLGSNTICNGYLSNGASSGGALLVNQQTGVNNTLRPHITLNPYSTQLVESINMMMPANNNNNNSTSSSSTDSTSAGSHLKPSSSANSSSSNTTSNTLGRPMLQQRQQHAAGVFSPQLANLTSTLRGSANGGSVLTEQPSNGDVVYRAVSPHGHVYWEIDPGQVYAAAVAANSKNLLKDEENVSLLMSAPHRDGRQLSVSSPSAELKPLTTFPAPLQCSASDLVHRPETVMMPKPPSNHGVTESSPAVISQQQRSNAFVRNRFRQLQVNAKKAPSRNGVLPTSRVSAPLSTLQTSFITTNAAADLSLPTDALAQVPEQLQTQVQIRDIRPIQVSVKSSEYIEAKIRTLRKNNIFLGNQ